MVGLHEGLGITSTQLVSNAPMPNNYDNYTEFNTVNIAMFDWDPSWNFTVATTKMATTFKTTQCSILWCLKKYIRGVKGKPENNLES